MCSIIRLSRKRGYTCTNYLSINDISFKSDIFKRRNKILRTGILDTIDAYYEGDPVRAYQLLSTSLKDSNLNGYLNKEMVLEEGSNLFRLRVINQNYPLSKEDLFHIPFDKRSLVSTQRFSISGLPSLYLANSIYVAWEEMKRPSMNEVQVVRIVNNHSMNMLDLTTDIFSRNTHLIDNLSYGWQLLYKVMVWPLIAACSVRVQNPNDPFKPEYVIPQLLLQWVNKHKVFGIKYSSTYIDLDTSKHEGSFYNIVVPVRTFNREKGHCPELLKSFNSTQVVPFQIRQIATITDRLSHQESIRSNINKDITGLELIKGYVQPNASTIFGVMEHNLNGIKTESFKIKRSNISTTAGV